MCETTGYLSRVTAAFQRLEGWRHWIFLKEDLEQKTDRFDELGKSWDIFHRDQQSGVSNKNSKKSPAKFVATKA